VRPAGSVLKEHLAAGRAVAVQEQTGGAGPAPVPMAEGAEGPAVGRGVHGEQ
jgi:hypothetical protein